MIRILTGPIRSYKTTTLLDWCTSRTDCGGVLSLDTDGLRRLYNVYDKTSIAWQKPESTDPADLIIGRFVFDQHAFQLAVLWMDAHLSNPMIEYFILDEIGPLELKGLGWDQWVQKSLHILQSKSVILVVRDFLLDDVIRRYHLESAEVISKAHFS